MENAESFLWSMFEGQHASINKSPADQTLSTSRGKKKQKRNEARWSSQQESANQNEDCNSNILSSIKSKVRDRCVCDFSIVFSHTSGISRFLV